MMTRSVPLDSCPALQKKIKAFQVQPGGVFQVQLLPTQPLQLPLRRPLQLHLVPAITVSLKRQRRFFLGKTWRGHGALKAASSKEGTSVPLGYGFVEQARKFSHDWDLMSNGNQVAILRQTV